MHVSCWDCAGLLELWSEGRSGLRGRCSSDQKARSPAPSQRSQTHCPRWYKEATGAVFFLSSAVPTKEQLRLRQSDVWSSGICTDWCTRLRRDASAERHCPVRRTGNVDQTSVSLSSVQCHACKLQNLWPLGLLYFNVCLKGKIAQK